MKILFIWLMPSLTMAAMVSAGCTISIVPTEPYLFILYRSECAILTFYYVYSCSIYYLSQLYGFIVVMELPNRIENNFVLL